MSRRGREKEEYPREVFERFARRGSEDKTPRSPSPPILAMKGDKLRHRDDGDSYQMRQTVARDPVLYRLRDRTRAGVETMANRHLEALRDQSPERKSRIIKRQKDFHSGRRYVNETPEGTTEERLHLAEEGDRRDRFEFRTADFVEGADDQGFGDLVIQQRLREARQEAQDKDYEP